jgi:hypothetical protein
MSEDDFVTFKKYNALTNAEEFAERLKTHGIEVQIVDDSPPVDITFSGNTLQNQFRVKIKQSDFEVANQIVEQHAEEIINDYPEDHYLHEFTNEELLEILEKYDEWSKEDYLFAQKLLKDRGQEVSTEALEKLKEQRKEEFLKPEKGHSGWLIFGFISAILGGIFGICIGWFHWTFKKTVPTGERVYAYDLPTRRTGKTIFWVGVLSLTTMFLLLTFS